MRTYTAVIRYNNIGRTMYPLDIDARVDGTTCEMGTCGHTARECIEDIERMVREQYGSCRARSIRYEAIPSSCETSPTHTLSL